MKRILLLRGAELIVFAFLATIPLLVVNPYALGLLTLLAIYGILHAKVPALRSSYILSGATDLHVRESRKIHGVYTSAGRSIVNHFSLEEADVAQPRHESSSAR